MAQNILTPEEKKYLGKVSRYLSSLGMSYGEISFEMEPDDYEISYRENYFPTHFENNYNAEIPDGLVPILKKIISYVDDEGLHSELPDDGEIDYQRFEITIDSVKKEISLTHSYSYQTEGDTQGVEYDDMIEEWEEKGVFDDIEIPEDNYLVLKYNGGGDSGYIESHFDSGARNPYGESVPTEVEEWCYQQLEENFGGWEINEGSQGEFQFDFNEKTVILSHTYNIEESKSNTLWEEEF
jgi:hypothetical protein